MLTTTWCSIKTVYLPSLSKKIAYRFAMSPTKHSNSLSTTPNIPGSLLFHERNTHFQCMGCFLCYRALLFDKMILVVGPGEWVELPQMMSLLPGTVFVQFKHCTSYTWIWYLNLLLAIVENRQGSAGCVKWIRLLNWRSEGLIDMNWFICESQKAWSINT